MNIALAALALESQRDCFRPSTHLGSERAYGCTAAIRSSSPASAIGAAKGMALVEAIREGEGGLDDGIDCADR